MKEKSINGRDLYEMGTTEEHFVWTRPKKSNLRILDDNLGWKCKMELHNKHSESSQMSNYIEKCDFKPGKRKQFGIFCPF